MLSRRVFEIIVKRFVREQLYASYQQRVAESMKGSGRSYITCMSYIDKFGVFNPTPCFREEKAIDYRLTTDKPDIGILQPLYSKYGIVEFTGDGSGCMVSKYPYLGSTDGLKLLNRLKYNHLNARGSSRLCLMPNGPVYLSEDERKRVVGSFGSGS